jgi:hypothetical protein
VRPRPIKIRNVVHEDAAQVLLVQDQQVIQTFAPDAPQESFARRIGPWSLDRRAQHLNPASCRDGVEVWTVLRVVVTNNDQLWLTAGKVLETTEHERIGCWLRSRSDAFADRVDSRADQVLERAEQVREH